MSIFGVDVEETVEREYILDDRGLLDSVEDTHCFQITPITAHITGSSPKNFQPRSKRDRDLAK